MVLNKYYGDTGVDQLDTGGNPIFTFLSSVMNDREVLADDGRAYSNIQTAENNASGFILIGPGTYDESVTLDTANMNVRGSGLNTFIDRRGSSGDSAISFGANDISVSNLKIAADDANNGTISDSGVSGWSLDSVKLEASNTAIDTNSGTSDVSITNCISIADGSDTGRLAGSRFILSNILTPLSSNNGSQIRLRGSNQVLSNSINLGGADQNIEFSPGTDCIAYGCRTRGNSGGLNDAIVIDGSSTDNIVAKCRVEGSISDSGTNTTLDDNEIDPAN